MTRSTVSALTAVSSLALASPAWACAVCGVGTNSMDQGAYLWMTGVMSFLPLAMLGGLVWWVARRVQAAQAEESRAVAGVPMTPPAGTELPAQAPVANVTGR